MSAPNSSDDQSAPSSDSGKAYWRQNLIVISVLLSIWAIVSFGCSIFGIQWLNQFRVGNVPLGFWIAQQGSMYVFLVLILVYALVMDYLDRKYNVKE